MNDLGPLNREQRALAERHLGLVEPNARALSRYLRPPMRVEDLAAAGRVGLLEAAHRFDPTQTRTFAEYAVFRVRGAMIDAMKRESTHRRYVDLTCRKAGYDCIAEQRRGGNPLTDTDEDVRARLDESVDATFASMFAALVGAVARIEGEDGAALREAYATATRTLQTVLGTLAPTERKLVELRFFEDATWEGCAQELGLSVKGARLLEAEVMKRLGQRLRWLGVTSAPSVEGR